MKRKREVWHGSGARQRSNHRDDKHGTSDGELSYFLHVTELGRQLACVPLLLLTSTVPSLEHKKVLILNMCPTQSCMCYRRRTCPFFPAKLFLRFVVVANGKHLRFICIVFFFICYFCSVPTCALVKSQMPLMVYHQMA